MIYHDCIYVTIGADSVLFLRVIVLFNFFTMYFAYDLHNNNINNNNDNNNQQRYNLSIRNRQHSAGHSYRLYIQRHENKPASSHSISEKKTEATAQKPRLVEAAHTWTCVGFTHGLGWVALGWVRREQLHIIQLLRVKYWTPAFTTSTLYFSKIESVWA